MSCSYEVLMLISGRNWIREPLIDYLYRAVAPNSYSKIGAMGSNDLSEMHDYGANRNQTSQFT